MAVEQMRTRDAAGFVLLVGAVAGCSGQREERKEKPKPPDMSVLRAAYDAPGGALDDALMKQVAVQASEAAGLLSELAVDDQLLGAVEAALAGINGQAGNEPQARPGETTGTRRQELAIEGDGWLRATRICNGWGAQPVPDPENGTLVLTATFSEKGPDPTLWGSTNACKYRVADLEVLLDSGAGAGSDLRLWIGEGLGWSDLGTQPILFDLDMDAELQASPLPLRLDFRLDLAEERVELRIGVASGGDVVVVMGGGQIVGVRAINGLFSCDPVPRTCVSDTGVTVGW
jgi:hypothetical protein